MTMLLGPFGSLLETPRQRQLQVGRTRAFYPAMDLVASDEELRLVMDVPGFRNEDLEIELSEGVLRIRGERRYPWTSGQGGHSIHRLERGYGRFEQVLRVSEDVDPGALAATIEDGVLTLRIPVPEARKPRRIEIRSGETPRVIDAEWSTEGGEQAGAEGDADAAGRELAGAGAGA